MAFRPRLLEEEEAPPQGVKGNRDGGHALVPSRIAPLGKDHGTAKQGLGGGWDRQGPRSPCLAKGMASVKLSLRASGSGKDAEERVKNHTSHLKGRATQGVK